MDTETPLHEIRPEDGELCLAFRELDEIPGEHQKQETDIIGLNVSPCWLG